MPRGIGAAGNQNESTHSAQVFNSRGPYRSFSFYNFQEQGLSLSCGVFYIDLDPERAPSRPYREPWEPQSTRQGSTSAATGSKWRTREAEISVPAKYLPRKQTTSTQRQQLTYQTP